MRIAVTIAFVMFIGIILIHSVSASDLKLLCLDEGDTLKFSRCNPSIDDRSCEASTGCNYCVHEIRNGVYCPASLNLCNAAELSCSAIQEQISNDNPEDDEEDDDQEDDNTNNQNTNNDQTTTTNQNDTTTKKTTASVNSTSAKNDLSVGFNLGTKIVKPESGDNSTSDKSKSTSPTPITGFNIGATSKQKNIIYFLLGMSLIEIIIILGLSNFQKNKIIKKNGIDPKKEDNDLKKMY